MQRTRRTVQRRCRCCGEKFDPDPRKGDQHWYCAKPQCRQASKAASQRRWLEKAENRHYFQGPESAVRKREWRRTHPDGKCRKRGLPAMSQDLIDTQVPEG